ncbi:MAG: hypothetical protein AB1673_07425 [Actinomycetota bacterium]
MVVDGPTLATELRRRRVRPKSVADGVEAVQRSTWIAGDLRAADTALLVLAALSLTPGEEEPANAWPDQA